MANNFAKSSHHTELNDIYTDQPSEETWLNDLMNEYGQEIIWLAYSYVRDRAIAEDLAQNAFIKCYQKREEFKNNSSIKTWIYRITINCCKDYLRSSYVKRNIPTNMKEILNRERAPSSESAYMEKDTSSTLIECVFSLGPKYREVIILHYFEELKVREIKEILQLNENTIKTRLKKAKEILRKKIDRGDF
ncbi:sigma-70 family RNA polymerase sigma factor [Gracilibacillus oryzae]|uniref:Sigma-70 family RNA polymerase sigma factor n=1 Tax=Gracilibacillus oryzae TaxID=1672701 RepID=A0A7C8KY49_9BACI|nr:sigma-70 family RNA polymerase sigma factor [Gracilibacillus oryzae]KAB8139332.1 sigma-70 family RNA polymerase sigma factor [Gracilibacillus oryzae]